MTGRFRAACMGLLFSGLATLAAAPPGGPIRLPEAPVVPTPMPTPGGSLALNGSQWYVIEADVECSVRSYPKGLVRVTREAGPLRLKGQFAGGTGKVETRSYKGPHLYVVEATGNGSVDLEVIPLGFKNESEIVSASLIVDTATDCPDVKPVPPKPVDPVNPKVESFRVVIVYESSKPMSAEQVGIVYGREVEQYLSGITTKDGPRNGWRRHDKDDAATGDSEAFNALWAKAKPKVATVPCLAIEVNGVVTVEPLPATIADTITFLKTRAGGK